MPKRFVVLGILLLAATAGGFLVSRAQDLPRLPKMSPVNPDFTRYVEDLRLGRVRHTTSDGYPLGYVPSPVRVSGVPVAASGLRANGYPAALDLRSSGKVTPVKDQGSCGEC